MLRRGSSSEKKAAKEKAAEEKAVKKKAAKEKAAEDKAAKKKVEKKPRIKEPVADEVGAGRRVVYSSAARRLRFTRYCWAFQRARWPSVA